MPATPQPIPLYVAARSPSGSVFHLLMKDVGTTDPDGPFYCRVSAPNGRVAEGEVQHLDYAAVRTLFRTREDLFLAVEGAVTTGAGEKLKGADIQLWSDGKPVDLPDGSFELVQGRRGTSHIRIFDPPEAPIDHVQMWVKPGAVTVTVWPTGGMLFPLPGRPDVQRRVRPVIVGDDLLCSAYWGFCRHSNIGAVRELGSLILAKATEPGASENELAVAAHFATSFLDPSPDVLLPLVRRLERGTSSDAAILLWSIVVDYHLDYSPEQRCQAFEKAVLALAGTGCLYTGVFRMLVERLGEGAELWREDLGALTPPPDVERAIAWAMRLAQATYWDAEYLTYRALDPSRPDANATDDQLGIGTKKKSALVPFS